MYFLFCASVDITHWAFKPNPTLKQRSTKQEIQGVFALFR